MADFEAWLVFLILVVNVVGELQRKRPLAASHGFLAAARLSCFVLLLFCVVCFVSELYLVCVSFCTVSCVSISQDCLRSI